MLNLQDEKDIHFILCTALCRNTTEQPFMNIYLSTLVTTVTEN